MEPAPHRAISLAMIGIGSALIYIAAAMEFPLFRYYAAPLANLDRITRSDPRAGMAIGMCILLLFGGYALGVITLGRWVPEGRAALLVLLPPAIFAITLIFVYPTTSLDIYDYLFRGRMAVRYGANTFIQPPSDFAYDPLLRARPLRFIPWNHAVTAYGPLWELLSQVAAMVAGERPGPMPRQIDPWLQHLMLSYKLLGLGGYAACGAAIWGALGKLAPERRWQGLYLWLWNPLVLWESVAAAHNDAWMAATLVAAVWAIGYARERDPEQIILAATGAFLALTMGGLIKYIALIFGLVVLSSALKRLESRAAQLALLLFGGAACAALVFCAYLPFWQGMETLRNFSDRGSLFNSSWLTALALLLTRLGVPDGIAQQLASALGMGLLAEGVAWAAWRAWRQPAQMAAHFLWLTIWFLCVASAWFQPWYLVWAMALVAIQPQRRRALGAVVLFCLTAMQSYVAVSFLLPALGWRADSLAWNLLLPTLVFAPPLLVLGLRRATPAGSRPARPGPAREAQA